MCAEPATCRGGTAQTGEGEQRRRGLVAWSWRARVWRPIWRNRARACKLRAPHLPASPDHTATSRSPDPGRQAAGSSAAARLPFASASGAAVADFFWSGGRTNRAETARRRRHGISVGAGPVIDSMGGDRIRHPSASTQVAGLSLPGKVLSPHFSTHYRNFCCNPTNPRNNCLTATAASVQCR